MQAKIASRARSCTIPIVTSLPLMTPLPNKPGPRNKVRIIGGTWRGRLLSFADLESLRPSADRIRETLFNWLQSDIIGSSCLDLYAGSAVLGFEALSRGAASVTCVEIAGPACAAIKSNLEQLQNGHFKLVQADACTWLQKEHKAQVFDIVFLDPPFGKELLEQSCHLLETHHWLSPDAKIYLESDQPLEQLTLPENWQLIRSKKAGKVYFGLCSRAEAATKD